MRIAVSDSVSGHRKPPLGMPLFTQVLPVVVSAGDDLAACADLRSIKSFHRPVLLQCSAGLAGSLGALTPSTATASLTNPPTDRDNLQFDFSRQ